MKKIKGVLFDFDGVIHNTFHTHLRNIREFSGYPLTEQEYRDMHNGNFHGHSLDGLKDMDWLAYRNFVRKHFGELVIDPEVQNSLRELARERELFIVSSGGESVIREYLERNGVLEIFRTVLGREFHASKVDKFKYIFQHYGFGSRESVFVTDTLGDILEANVVGLETIAVDFGFHSREKLQEGNPYSIVSDFKDIITVVESYESREQTERWDRSDHSPR